MDNQIDITKELYAKGNINRDSSNESTKGFSDSFEDDLYGRSPSVDNDVTKYEISLKKTKEKHKYSAIEQQNEDTKTYVIPFAYANKHGVFYHNQENCMYHKKNLNRVSLLEILRAISLPNDNHKSIEIKKLSDEEFAEKIEQFYSQQSQNNKMADALGDESEFSFEDAVAAIEEPDDLLASEDEAPIIKLLNAIFFEAIKEKASDIHVEAYEKNLLVRFRIDGVLQTRLTTKSILATLLITRIKVLARLDIAEKRLPQDGRIGLKLGGKLIDLRVSTIPTAYGERTVMRLLDRQANKLDLETLGMPSKILKIIKSSITKPNGIILVTGPTGSGKTTTLYAALEQMDRKENNIMTIEDPIEYYFDGISQTQVNTKANMSFAKGLRAILRQDPDIVMIGEVRDSETAKIAVQSSLTGHLVLSTVHTNSAVGTITRLIDMGVEEFLLASTLRVVLAQRLVRRLCQHCRKEVKLDEGAIYLISMSLPDRKLDKTYIARGCSKCSNTGYIGRLGVYEIVTIDDTVRQMITEGKSELEISKYVFDNKYNHNLRQNAFELVLEGKTSYSEAVKISF